MVSDSGGLNCAIISNGALTLGQMLPILPMSTWVGHRLLRCLLVRDVNTSPESGHASSKNWRRVLPVDVMGNPNPYERGFQRYFAGRPRMVLFPAGLMRSVEI